MKGPAVEPTSADQAIQEGLAAGDSTVLDMIWTTYSSDMLGYLVSLHGSLHEAEDSLQEVFVALVRKRETVAKAHKLKPYLYRMARNIALNRIRKNQRRRDRDRASAVWLELEGEQEAPDSRSREIEAALATLPEKQRSVVVLKFFRAKTFPEIGEMLGISENTAGSRYRYGMKKLRGLLGEKP